MWGKTSINFVKIERVIGSLASTEEFGKSDKLFFDEEMLS